MRDRYAVNDDGTLIAVSNMSESMLREYLRDLTEAPADTIHPMSDGTAADHRARIEIELLVRSMGLGGE